MLKLSKLAALAATALSCAAQTDWTTQVQNKPFVDAREYNWFRTNGKGATGDLSAPGANTVTVTPCPKGPDATDTTWGIAITDGVGTAEGAMVTGGTCTSGAATGTLEFTTLNAHTGAWKIRSGTAGIQEAAIVDPSVIVPPGTYDIYATITPPTGAHLVGAGSGMYSSGSTTLRFYSANTKLFNIVNDNVHLRHLTLAQAPGVAATTGNIGIYIAGAGSAVAGAAANWGQVYDVTLSGFYYGVYNAGDGGQIDLTRVSIKNTVSTGVVALGAQGWWEHVTVQFAGQKQTTPVAKIDQGHGIYVATCPAHPNCGTSPWMSGIQTFSNYGWGLYIDAAGLTVSGARSYFNNDRAGEVYADASGNLASFSIELAGQPVAPFAANPTATGLEIGPNASNLSISDGLVVSTNGIGVLVNGVGAEISSVNSFSNGLGGTPGTEYAFKVAANNTTISHCQALTDPVMITGATFANLNNNIFSGGTAAIPALHITGNSAGASVDQNAIINAAGGNSFQCDAGSSLNEGSNWLGGTIANNCAKSAGSVRNFPLAPMPLDVVEFANLGGGVAGTVRWCPDCTIGDPCSGSGTGAIAVSSGAVWSCK